MKKVMMFIMAVTVFFIGCSSEQMNEESLEFKITNVSSSLGLFEGDPAYQDFGYEITVENVSSVPIEVDYAEPVILNDVKIRMKETDLKLPIDAVMEKNNFVTLKKNFLFKADDLTKEEISSLKIIEGVMIYTKSGKSIFVKLD